MNYKKPSKKISDEWWSACISTCGNFLEWNKNLFLKSVDKIFLCYRETVYQQIY